MRELSQLQSGTVWDARMASGLSRLAEPAATLIVCEFYHSSARLIHVYEHTRTNYLSGEHTFIVGEKIGGEVTNLTHKEPSSCAIMSLLLRVFGEFILLSVQPVALATSVLETLISLSVFPCFA